MRNDKLKSITVYFNEEEHQQIRAEAADKGVTMSALVRIKLGLPMIHRGPPTNEAILLKRQEGRCVVCERLFNNQDGMAVVQIKFLKNVGKSEMTNVAGLGYELAHNVARDNLQLICGKCIDAKLAREAKLIIGTPEHRKARTNKTSKKGKK